VRLGPAGLALIAGVAIAGCGSTNGPGGAPALPAIHHRTSSSSPIQHVIIVIQENRSFDDLFATFPNADGTTTGQGEPMPGSMSTYCSNHGMPVITQSNETIPLTKASLVGAGFPGNFGEGDDLPHVYGWYGITPFLDEYDNGSMDGFDLEGSGANGNGSPLCTYPYQYINPDYIKEYWALAQQYVLADHTFQTQGSGSFTAHQDLIAGGTAVNYPYSGYSDDSVIDNPTYWPWGCDAPPGVKTSLITTSLKYLQFDGPYPCFAYATMRDLLDAQSISWKYYAQKVSGGNGLWSAFDAIAKVRCKTFTPPSDCAGYGPEWTTNIGLPSAILKDVMAGNLAAVSWVTPTGANSDHPDIRSNGKLVDNGPSWVASVVNAVGESKYWNSTAIIILWDDWGGFYDHLSPPCLYQSQCRDNQGGLGFRVPMIIVSPYVTAHVEHTQYEFGSILKYIEGNWNLGSLGATDERATSILNAFNYKQSPRKFKKIHTALPLSFFLHEKPSGAPPDTE